MVLAAHRFTAASSSVEPQGASPMDTRVVRNQIADSFALAYHQVLLGPHEMEIVDIASSKLTFSYLENNNQAALEFFVCSRNGEPARLVLTVNVTDFIKGVAPKVGTNFTGALWVKLSPKCSYRLQKRLDLYDYIHKHYNQTTQDLPRALENLIFVLKPWSEFHPNLYVMLWPKAPPGCKKKWIEFHALQHKMKKLAMVRWEDMQNHDKVPATARFNPNFYEEVEFDRWCDATARMGIKIYEHPERRSALVYTNYAMFRDQKKNMHYAPRPIPRTLVEVQPVGHSGKSDDDEVDMKDFDANHVQNMMAVTRSQSDTSYVKPPSPQKIMTCEKIKAMYAANETALAQLKPPPTKRARKSETAVISLNDDDEEDTMDTTSSSSSATQLFDVTASTRLVRYLEGKNAITLMMSDMKRLEDGEMLNDNIVEFYLRYLATEYGQNFRPSTGDSVHVFNTYFFPKLTEAAMIGAFRGRSGPRMMERRQQWLAANFEKIKSWNRRVDLFSKDILIIPIHLENHWFVVFVLNPGKALVPAETKIENAEKFEPNDVAQIYVIDSYVDATGSIIRNHIDWIVANFLEHDFNAKAVNYPDKQFVADLVRTVEVHDVPQQENLVDCGCYLLAFTENFLARRPKPNKVDTKLVVNFADWCPLFTAFLALMRTKIRAMIRNLAGPEKWKQLEEFERMEKVKEETESSEKGLVKKAKQGTFIRVLEENSARRARRHSITDVPSSRRVEGSRRRSRSVPCREDPMFSGLIVDIFE